MQLFTNFLKTVNNINRRHQKILFIILLELVNMFMLWNWSIWKIFTNKIFTKNNLSNVVIAGNRYSRAFSFKANTFYFRIEQMLRINQFAY